MTKPTRNHQAEAKRLSSTIAALAKLDTSPPRLAALLATVDETAGADAWGTGSSEVAVATSGKSDPTARLALVGYAPVVEEGERGKPDNPKPRVDPLAALVGNLLALEPVVLRLLNGWGSVDQLAVEAPGCVVCGTVPTGALRGGLCVACYHRKRRAG